MNFEKEYFINSKTSNYKCYTTKKYNDLALELISFLNLKEGDYVLDFGCATGHLLKCIKCNTKCKVKGTDISLWAIEYGKKNFGLQRELEYYNINLLATHPDYIFFLDVLEHIESGMLNNILKIASESVKKAILVRVPVSLKEGENFVLEVSRNDKTHIQVHCKSWWINLFKKYQLTKIEYVNLKHIYNSDGVLAVLLKK